MNKLTEKIDGLIFSIGISAVIFGITYASKLYYFFIQNIPLSFLSFHIDDFTKFSFIPILISSALASLILYFRFSFGRVFKSDNWLSNAILEFFLFILIVSIYRYLKDIEIQIFQSLSVVCLILSSIHGGSFAYPILVKKIYRDKFKDFYAEALAIKYEAEFLREENEKIVQDTNIPSNGTISEEDRKKLHEKRKEALKTRFSIEKTLSYSKIVLAELTFDFSILSKYAKYLTFYMAILTLPNFQYGYQEIS